MNRKLSIDSISEAEKQKVYDFGRKSIETCKTRQFIQLSQRVGMERRIHTV